jgi:hypothetical protein
MIDKDIILNRAIWLFAVWTNTEIILLRSLARNTIYWSRSHYRGENFGRKNHSHLSNYLLFFQRPWQSFKSRLTITVSSLFWEKKCIAGLNLMTFIACKISYFLIDKEIFVSLRLAIYWLFVALLCQQM